MIDSRTARRFAQVALLALIVAYTGATLYWRTVRAQCGGGNLGACFNLTRSPFPGDTQFAAAAMFATPEGGSR